MVLVVVCGKPSYGYEIIKEVCEITEGRHEVKSGTMYTTLRRMEQSKLVSSKWEKNDSGPDKRIYKITPKGKTFLKKWLEMVMERKKMLDKMAGFYKKHFGGKK